MTHLGSLSLYLALVITAYAIFTSLWGVLRRQEAWDRQCHTRRVCRVGLCGGGFDRSAACLAD